VQAGGDKLRDAARGARGFFRIGAPDADTHRLCESGSWAQRVSTTISREPAPEKKEHGRGGPLGCGRYAEGRSPHGGPAHGHRGPNLRITYPTGTWLIAPGNLSRRRMGANRDRLEGKNGSWRQGCSGVLPARDRAEGGELPGAKRRVCDLAVRGCTLPRSRATRTPVLVGGGADARGKARGSVRGTRKGLAGLGWR